MTKRKFQQVVRTGQNELVGEMYKLDRSKIVTLHTYTDARAKKTNNPFPNKKIWKYSIVNGLFGVNYENCVNNQLAREGKEADFDAAAPVWGEKVNESRVLEDHVKTDGSFNLYFAFNPRNHLSTKYFDDDGNELTKEEVEPFLPARKPSSRQGTDKEVIWRKYKVQSILAVVTDGKILEVVENSHKFSKVKEVEKVEA